MNRRMHNKSFTVDNQVSIVGGRNIADEYFQLDTSGEFIDFDMLCAGPIAKDVSMHFDIYWNHKLAVPMDAFYDEVDIAELERTRNRIEHAMQDTGQSIYATAIHTELMQDLFSGSLEPYMADARMIVDDPQKLLEKVTVDQKIVATEIVKVGDVIQGIAGCPGIARGIARVVLDAADPRELGPGDVLIAPITDPSWTPLFLAADAVVVDVGATMSHAVIVSRELGIPCVVSAVAATTSIPDGATLVPL